MRLILKHKSCRTSGRFEWYEKESRSWGLSLPKSFKSNILCHAFNHQLNMVTYITRNWM